MNLVSLNLPHFQKKLLSWYDHHKRDLPWRKTKDPYAIWLSEIMLQQTNVETVIPYYHNFLKQMPTLADVAKANSETLLKLWAGLGYYSRIRNFHEATKEVQNHYQGNIPQLKTELIQLPGLGDYTASAIASIAFNQPEAVVDGNVMRVISRLFCYGEDIISTQAKKYFQEQATTLLHKKRAGDFNQAMMELGATVCSPTKPLCLLCPVNSYCQAYSLGVQETLPFKAKKTVYKNEELVASIYCHHGKYLLRKRSKKEILSGMWEFPLTPKKKSKKITGQLLPINHAIMNRRIKIYPILVSKIKKNANSGYRWFKPTQLNALPLTTITKKIIQSSFEKSSPSLVAQK